MSDTEALDELVKLARQRGRISMEDVRKVLPVDSMSVEDIARIVVRLEESGFELEIDPSLEATEGKTTASEAPAAELDPALLPPEKPQTKAVNEQALDLQRANRPQKNAAVPRTRSVIPPSSLPWILAFAILLLAVFAAFAF